MSGNREIDVISLLKGIEKQANDNAYGLPQQVKVKDEWNGIAFRTGEHRVVTPLHEVVEIHSCPELSMVPRTKSWVSGIANIRGTLLPVIDLGKYLRDKPVRSSRQSRVMVIRHAGLLAGVIVDEVLGLTQFEEEEYTKEISMEDDSVKPFIKYGFRRGNEYWPVFSLHRLAESQHFQQAAV
jgi:twitching motility protein PilI